MSTLDEHVVKEKSPVDGWSFPMLRSRFIRRDSTSSVS